jgi:hypothetical protein
VEVFVTGTTIECTSSHQELMLELYSISGQNIFSKKLSSGHSSVSMNELANGLYFMKLETPSGKVVLTQKFIVSD